VAASPEAEAPLPPPAGGTLAKRYPADLVLIRLTPEIDRLEAELLDLDATIDRVRRESLLLDDARLTTITRYEAHLRRQLTQYLHELEALQSRRTGHPTPFARLDLALTTP
jgi:hypothetical protein